MTHVPLVIIAAVARNRVIGAKGGLAWRLSSDLKRFKALTVGRPLVMGRKTFQSIGRPLPGRETIVVTRDLSFRPEGAFAAHSLEAALDLAAERARATRLYLTEVAIEAEGETRFPPIDPSDWREAKREKGARGPKDEADFEFVEYRRRG